MLKCNHMQEAGVALAAIGVLGSIAAVLGWTIKFLLREFNHTQSDLSKSIQKQANSADRLNVSISRRDVREEEFHTKVMQQFDKLNEKADRNLEAVANMKVESQTVNNQVVKHEVVKSKE